jgi:hypothetical protein
MERLRAAMKIVCLIAACLFLAPFRAPAQLPPFAGRGPRVQASFGYTYFRLAMTSSNRLNLHGLDAGLTANFLPRLGTQIDVGYARSANVFGSGHHADVLAYLAGPVFYPARHGRLSTYLHGLFGGARVTGVVPVTSGPVLLGYANRPSWALGGGIEYRVSPSLSFQMGADDVHTAFFNSAKAIQGQENLRVAFSLVYFFSARPRR